MERWKYIIVMIMIKHLQEKNLRGVMASVLDCNILN